MSRARRRAALGWLSANTCAKTSCEVVLADHALLRLQEEQVAEWNEPLDLSFACTSLMGWPKLSIQVYQSDFWGRIDLGEIQRVLVFACSLLTAPAAGYAWCHVPTTAGKHVVELVVSRPRGSWWDDVSAYFLGGTPRYEKPQVVLGGESRFGHRTVSTGLVEVEMNVVFKGFQRNIKTAAEPEDDNSTLCDGCPPSKNKDSV
jgi:B9 domain-containing protein 2